MASNISFQPYSTTTAYGSFSVQSQGYMQGVALDDPTVRYQLAGGVLASTETIPMWGGVAISESLSSTLGTLGSSIARASATTNITGFSVSNQATSWITTPTSPAPSIGSGGMVPFYRNGSNARICVACDPSLVSLDGGLVTQQVSWDFNNQRLQAYDASTPSVTITSITPTYANGVYTLAIVAAAASVVGAVGDAITISGATNTGTGGASLVNGNFIVTSYTDNQHFSIQITAASGAIGTVGGSPVLIEGTGALACKVISISSNSKIIQYDATNNLVTWVDGGTVAVILI